MKINKYCIYVISMATALGVFGLANAADNSKCGSAISFTFNTDSDTDITTVSAGTDVTMTEVITTTSLGAGNGVCGLSVGQNVNDGNAKIQAVQLAGEGRPCNDIGKSFCTSGTSAIGDNSCLVNGDCVTDPSGAGVCTPVTLNQLVQENNTPDGILEYALDTTGLGGQVLGFQASYTGGGNFQNADVICTDLTVNELESCTGATISIDYAEGLGAPAPGGPYEWGFDIIVHACENLKGVTAQGGTNGWAQLLGRSEDSLSTDWGSAEIRKANKKTDVILWTIGDMKAGDTARLSVSLSGSIPRNTPDCQIRYLSGAWSALFSTDGINFEKTDYTGRVYIYVDSNGNPYDCEL